ncbi:hypothetical protein ACJX0J_030957, partial [Zea mays]
MYGLFLQIMCISPSRPRKKLSSTTSHYYFLSAVSRLLAVTETILISKPTHPHLLQGAKRDLFNDVQTIKNNFGTMNVFLH